MKEDTAVTKDSKLTQVDLEYACSSDVQAACAQAGARQLGDLVLKMASEILARWAAEGESTLPSGVDTDTGTGRKLNDLERVARTATRGRWSRCTAGDGDCPCRTIWSKPLDDSPFCLAPSGPGEKVRVEDWDFVATFDPPTVLALITIARAAQAVRVAHRDELRGDYEQDVHAELARALDAARLEEPAGARDPKAGAVPQR